MSQHEIRGCSFSELKYPSRSVCTDIHNQWAGLCSRSRGVEVVSLEVEEDLCIFWEEAGFEGRAYFNFRQQRMETAIALKTLASNNNQILVTCSFALIIFCMSSLLCMYKWRLFLFFFFFFQWNKLELFLKCICSPSLFPLNFSCQVSKPAFSCAVNKTKESELEDFCYTYIRCTENKFQRRQSQMSSVGKTEFGLSSRINDCAVSYC